MGLHSGSAHTASCMGVGRQVSSTSPGLVCTQRWALGHFNSLAQQPVDERTSRGKGSTSCFRDVRP